jgi:hypothetical protein
MIPRNPPRDPAKHDRRKDDALTEPHRQCETCKRDLYDDGPCEYCAHGHTEPGAGHAVPKEWM